MADMTGEYDWTKYFSEDEKISPERAKYAEGIRNFLKNGSGIEQNLTIVIANNLVAHDILEKILADDHCPEQFFEKAAEALMRESKDFSQLFQVVISSPKIPDIVLKNCCENANKLSVNDIDKVVDILRGKENVSDELLNTVVKSLYRNIDSKADVLAKLLQNSAISERVLKFSTNLLHTIEDNDAKKKIAQIIIKHPNYNDIVAKSIIQNGAKSADNDTLLKTNVDTEFLVSVINSEPHKKVLLSESIKLLSHMENKTDFDTVCRAILANDLCTQDVVKSLLHKASYTPYFHDACQMVQENKLLTKTIKDKIANLERQYPTRIANANARKELTSYIRHPTAIPNDITADQLSALINETSRYAGVEVKFEDKQNVYRAVIHHPNCSAKVFSKVLQLVPIMGDEVLDLMHRNNEEARKGWGLFKEFKKNRAEINGLSERNFDSKQMSELVNEAYLAAKSNNPQIIESFKDKIFAAGEDVLYKLDHNAVEWFIHDGSKENLQKLNCLRGMYGLKTVVEDFYHADADRTDAKRVLFGGEVSAVNKYIDEESGEINPHYKRKHSDIFLEFNPKNYMDKTFNAADYHLEENQALQKMADEGLQLPKTELAEMFAEIHMPPELALQLNSTDLIHYLLEGKGYDVEKGQPYKLKEFDPNVTEGIRDKYWKKLADNEQLVDFISADLWRKGVPQETIDQIWENCRNNGAPTKGDDGLSNVFGISLQIHHCRALKDGGENIDDNFVVVLSTKNAGMNIMNLNSHQPLHEYDNPGVMLYMDNDGKISQTKTDKRIKILTFPAENCSADERVAVYNGPSRESCGVINSLGNVRKAEYSELISPAPVRNNMAKTATIEY